MIPWFQFLGQIESVEQRGEVKHNDSDEGLPAEEQHVPSYVKHTQHTLAVTAGKWILMTSYRCVILQLRVSLGDMLNVASCKFGWILIGAYVINLNAPKVIPTVLFSSVIFFIVVVWTLLE